METSSQVIGNTIAEAAQGVQGIDISHHSGDVAWPEVRAQGIVFAFAKSTEGMTFVDPKFSENWSGMAAAGIIRGAYHYYTVGDDPASQAKNFIATVPLTTGGLPPVLDVEQPGQQPPQLLAADLKVWLDLVESHYGVTPLINTDPDFWNVYVRAQLGSYPLWVSNTDVASPNLPRGWQSWTFWQYRQNVPVQGVPKGADRSVFQGSLAQLREFVQSSGKRQAKKNPSAYPG